MDIIGLIIMIIDKVVTTSLNLSRKRIERNTLEQKSEGDLAIAKILAPAKMDQADEEFKQAQIRLERAKLESGSGIQASQSSVKASAWIWILLFLMIAGGGVMIYQNSKEND